MRLGQLAPVSSFRPGLHTATVYKQTTLYGRFSVHCSGITLENEPFCRAVYTNPFLETFFFVHIGSVQIQAPSVGKPLIRHNKPNTEQPVRDRIGCSVFSDNSFVVKDAQGALYRARAFH